MFPSSGYFRGLDCPFYASGLCERPYCHYRHAKQSSEKDPSWIGKSIAINQKLNNHLGDTLHHDTDKGLLIEKAAHLNEVDKTFPKSTYSCTSNKDLTKLYTYKPQVGLSGGTYDKANDSLDNSKYKPYTKYNCDGKSNYQPSCDNQIKKGRYEEYTISKKKEKKVSEYNCDIASNSVPEYNPTPISELKRMHRYSTQSTTHSDLEYDPVSNFDAGFSNKSFFNLLDNSYPSNQSVGDLNSGHSLYKPTKIPSDYDDEEHELVIDAKFSDDDDDDEEPASSRLSDQGSDNETKDPTESMGHQLSFSKNKADDSGYSAHISNTSSSSVSHKSSVDESKESVANSNKHVKTDSKSSSNEKLNKTSKSTNNDVKRHNHSVTTDSNKWKTSLDDKNKLEKNKSSLDNKIAKKKKISENDKFSSSEKKSSSDKRTSSEKKTSTIEKKVSSSHDKKISSEKKVSSSSSSEKKSSGCVSSSSSRDQSSIKKDKKEISSKEKSVAEKIKKIKESRSIHNEREVNGSSEKDRNVKEKEHRKSEHDRNGNVSKDRIKDENRKIEASSSLVKKSSTEHGIKKKSNSQTKTDSNKVKLDPERKKELERRKSEGERKVESNLKKLESVRRKSESEIKRIELEKKKDGMSCKNSLYLKRKESDKKSKDNSGIEKVRQETSMAKTEKLQRLKELNERVGVWKANRTDHKTNSEGEKIPAKIRKMESSKVGDFTKKKLTHGSSDSKKVSNNTSNNAIEKSKKRRLPSGENSHHESPAKLIKRENSEQHGCSSSDENPNNKKHCDLQKNSKHKISNNSHSKQQHSGVIKDKKNRSISIDDLFGEESSEDEGEESSGAFGQSGGDESTGLSDDDELNVIFGDTDLSENDPYEECLKIFNESNTQLLQQQRAAKDAEFAKKVQKKEIVETPDLQEGKKRVAHPGAASRQTDRFRKFVRPALARPTPAEVMQNRFLEKQKRLAAENKLQKEKSIINNLPSRSSKINLLKHKMNVPAIKTPDSYHFNNERTIAGTATKNEKRTAHIPKKELIKRPTINADYGSKITASVRQRYLNLMVDEYMKFVECPSKVSDLALQGEYEVYKSCNSKLGYLNKAIHFIKKLRGQSFDILGLPGTEKSLVPMKIPTQLPEEHRLEHIVTGRVLYERLKPYILTEDELQENHFPRPDGSGRAKFYLSDLNKDPYLPSDERFCVRCQKCYRVNSHGKSVVDDECTYHWAKHVPRRVGNSFENRHRCCLGERGSSGCEVAPNHVHHKNKFDGSSGYMSTPKKPIPHEGPGVFAMDCEMVYTTAGMELAQITVVDSQCVTIYESFVKPDHEVVDYNTRFSGVTEDDLKDCQVSLRQVQAVLLHNFSANTIVVGHSLESDLRAVKLVHSTVIDTSVMFPHRVGRPFKRALKTLAHDYLNMTIQEGENGHDSKEDAISAMRLVHYRMNQDGNNSRQ